MPRPEHSSQQFTGAVPAICRTVTSFYSNLVTRPTGRAVRMGVESQLAELPIPERFCIAVLDFTQVRILDYSCADEIVAKLLLRFATDSRPADAYFAAVGLQDHHLHAVEAVLEHHQLMLAVRDQGEQFHLLGAANPLERSCWRALLRRGRATSPEIAADLGVSPQGVSAGLAGLARGRIAIRFPDNSLSAVAALLSD